MLSNLPKILGRGFLVGFVLPSSLFCLYIQYISLNLPDISNIKTSIDELKVTPFIIVVLILSILLMAINRVIIRFLEGYGLLNPLRLLWPIQWLIYRFRIAPVFKEYEEMIAARASNTKFEPKIKNFQKRLLSATRGYPYEQRWLLPTKFGNVMRAFEVYSQAVYGLDSIAIWPRLSLTLPKEIKEQIQDGRAVIDFSANFLLLSVCALIASTTKSYYAASVRDDIVLILVPLICALFCWFNLPSAAQQWGVIIKSTIDVSRNRIAKDLGLELPKSAKQEREMWESVSRMTTFRSATSFDALDLYRKKPKEPKARPAVTAKPSS